MQVDVAVQVVVRGMGRAFQVMLQKLPEQFQGEIVNEAGNHAGTLHGIQVGIGDAGMDAARQPRHGRFPGGGPRRNQDVRLVEASAENNQSRIIHDLQKAGSAAAAMRWMPSMRLARGDPSTSGTDGSADSFALGIRIRLRLPASAWSRARPLEALVPDVPRPRAAG